MTIFQQLSSLNSIRKEPYVNLDTENTKHPYLAGGSQWRVQYEKPNNNKTLKWKGNTKILYSNVTDDEKKLAMLLNTHIYLTGVQIHNSIYYYKNGSFTKTKDTLNEFTTHGYLEQHHIIRPEQSNVPFYNVRAGTHEDVKIIPHNADRKYHVDVILKILSLNQLAIKMNKCRNVTKLKMKHNHDNKYDAVIEYENTEHQSKNVLKLISIRNYENNIIRLFNSLYRIDEPTVIVTYDKNTLDRIYPQAFKEGNRKIIRFTTDEILASHKYPLSESFYKINKEGKLEIDDKTGF